MFSMHEANELKIQPFAKECEEGEGQESNFRRNTYSKESEKDHLEYKGMLKP